MEEKLLHHQLVIHEVDKPWLVFIHGAGGSIATWKYQLGAFKEHFNVLLIDLRDHGRSDVEEADLYSFELIVEDIHQVITHHGIKKAHFMTLSFGSVLLQAYSLKYPKTVMSAVFTGGIFKANLWIKSFVYLAKLLNLILPYSWMYSLFSYLLMPKAHHQFSRKIYRKQAAKISSKAYMKWVGLYREFFELLDRFYHQKINFPSLVVMGKEDYVFHQAALQFSQHQKEVEFLTLEGAGHICNIDKSEAFNQHVLHFYHKHHFITMSEQIAPKASTADE